MREVRPAVALGDHAGERAAAHAALTHHPDSQDVKRYELRAPAALGRTDSVRLGVAELETMPFTPGAAPLTTLLVALRDENASSRDCAPSSWRPMRSCAAGVAACTIGATDAAL